jgi:hypothetical protein
MKKPLRFHYGLTDFAKTYELLTFSMETKAAESNFVTQNVILAIIKNSRQRLACRRLSEPRFIYVVLWTSLLSSNNSGYEKCTRSFGRNIPRRIMFKSLFKKKSSGRRLSSYGSDFCDRGN